MNTIPTDSKKRKPAAILFVIAAGLYFILNFAVVPMLFVGYRISFVQILYLLCLATVAVGLFLDKIPFPIAGAGFAGLTIISIVHLIDVIRLSSIISHSIIYICLYICFMLGFLAAAAILFIVVFGNEEMKKTAKKLAIIPFVLLLIACIAQALLALLLAGVLAVFLRDLLLLAVHVLILIGTKCAIEAYVCPEGKPKKAVTRADGTAAEAGDGYIGMSKHVLLLLFTFGIWLYIWIWRTTQYTNRAPGEEERNPTKKMLLCMFVPFYSIFWTYKTAQRIDTIAKTRGMSSEIATPCLVLAIFVGIVPPILMQDKINAIALNGNAPAAAPAAEPARDVGESTRAAADGVPEELEKYKRLLDNGVITQEEFEAKKKQLLGL